MLLRDCDCPGTVESSKILKLDEPQTFYMGQDKYFTDGSVTIIIFGKPHKFYIVPNDFPLIEDEIIGLPCLEQYQYEISNDKIRLDNNVLYFQKPRVVQPGERRVQTIYLQISTNSSETNQVISNEIENSRDLKQIDKLKTIVRTDHMEPELCIPIEKILIHYIDVFNLETDLLPRTNLTQHTITLKQDKIINTKSYRPPKCHNAEIEKQMKEIRSTDIIEESDSPYNSLVG